ncbi:hypothetical protein N7670_03075 [Stenotrophomonas maltophilia]|uniref:hypothetical protein n=1 Tax=Stenotrophomonas maltophilia TaxID=40324 RepID=UPI002449DB34|nr:hypothetical protein [Stenotrophomonas maltophilia]MDG9938223.1 hypothetical protein [Stenotrophomonas maltophilia]MDH0558199.1 hypothetical protein [Stenotrophomonas maltophilia]
MAIYIIFVPVGVFVWDCMGSLPQELRELPSDNAALISWGVTRSCFKHSNGRQSMLKLEELWGKSVERTRHGHPRAREAHNDWRDLRVGWEKR